MMRNVTIWLILFCLLISSCNTNNDVNEYTETSNPTEVSTGYPIIDNTTGVESGYPIIEGNSISYTQGPNFAFDTPVTKNNTVVSGSGPANVPIKLVDVSEMGLILGETIINSDGFFSFDLENSLETGHYIGIQLGDISGTDFIESDFLYNDNYYERPLIGVLFDMVLVE